jgi:hypothetical protein
MGSAYVDAMGGQRVRGPAWSSLDSLAVVGNARQSKWAGQRPGCERCREWLCRGTAGEGGRG